jgi:hypothetical protein
MRYQITLIKRDLLSIHTFEYTTKTSPDFEWHKFIERSGLGAYVEKAYGEGYIVQEIDPIDLPETPKIEQELEVPADID